MTRARFRIENLEIIVTAGRCLYIYRIDTTRVFVGVTYIKGLYTLY